MRKQKFRKAKLSLALASVLAGGLVASGPAQAVALANNDRLGDAGIFQYYTAQAGWQTFFRIINTSDQPVSVKLRFHEAANSREVLDFILFLSRRDEWVAWTDANALGDGTGPGIRTSDKSCLYGGPDGNNAFPPEGWTTLPNGVLAARFLDKAFAPPPPNSNVYYDNSSKTSLERLSEGYLEVIGIAAHQPGGQFDEQVQQKTPEACAFASSLYADDNTQDLEQGMGNVLAFNGYLIDLADGLGAGYDPDVLANFAQRSLVEETLSPVPTDSKPNLDSADPDGFAFPGPIPVAINQWDAAGNRPVPGQYEIDINGNGNTTDSDVPFDTSGDGICGPLELYDEYNAPFEAWDTNIRNKGDAVSPCYVAAGGDPVDNQLAANGPIWYPIQSENEFPNAGAPVRIAQNGKAQDAPVRGGVDWVSWELMRNAVINEWAAAFDPDKIVSDEYTQWVVTFPTKNYYVDLQNDPDPAEDISPTLRNTDSDFAFAPFTEKFPGGAEPGTSCDVYAMDMWNREERYRHFDSPQSRYPVDLCYEVNVVNFNERYQDQGLASKFSVTIPAELLPTDADGVTSTTGWAQMSFAEDAFGAEVADAGGPLWGLLRGEFVIEDPDAEEPVVVVVPSQLRLGLPVTGFLFTVYNTNNSDTNHAAVNAHKYQRITNNCQQAGGNFPCPDIPNPTPNGTTP